MWTTIVLVSALSVLPAQTDLSLTHARSTYGLLGPERPANAPLVPGDILFMSFDIEGITVDGDGKANYSTGLEVTDSSGKVVFKQQPQKAETKLSLGGNSVPGYAHISVGRDSPPGDYDLKIVVKDLASGKAQSLSRIVKVRLPKDLALVRAAVSVDLDGRYPAIVCACGQGIWVHCSAVGFERDRSSKQPSVDFEIRVLDERGKPIATKPTTNTVNKDVPEKDAGLPMAFPLTLNRAGKFTIELLANDRIGGKKAKLSFPLTVQAVSQER